MVETKELDCRGLACPGPVLQAKSVLDSDNPPVISVLVDNEAAIQNVSRFLGSRNYRVSVTEGPQGSCVMGVKEDAASVSSEAPTEAEHSSKIMVLISNDQMGHGDEALGEKLLASFLSTLKEMGKDLWRLVFINNGVKITAEGSRLLDALFELEKTTTILVCGTCLTHFGLIDKKKVGQTTNMLDIVTAMQLADKVITL